MEDFSNPLTVALLTMLMVGMAFVAYNHPKQFSAIFWTYISLYFVVFGLGWLLVRDETIIISKINHSWLSDAEKAEVVKIIKGPPTSKKVEFWINIIYYGNIYAAALNFLPLLGLSAEKKRDERRRYG